MGRDNRCTREYKKYRMECNDAPLLLKRHSLADCTPNVSFGCESPSSMWVTSGCRGIFARSKGDRQRVVCGYSGMPKAANVTCSMGTSTTRTTSGDDTPAPACVCQNGGFSFNGVKQVCRVAAVNHSLACVGDSRGRDVGSCCEYDTRRGCAAMWTPCRWHGDERIGWLHVPKTGTSFLITLALLANRSMAQHVQSGLAMRVLRKTHGVQWEGFFNRFQMESWFRGSSVFWVDGIAHAGVSTDVYNQFRGRLFALFRHPNERGWSAYNEFFGRAEQRQRFSPQEYARCIAGTQVSMLIGLVRSRTFAGIRCHLPVTDANNRTVCPSGCGLALPPTSLHMQLARTRLEEGFAFVGLTEEYALSTCLFSRMFRIPCLRELFDNSRPTSARGSSFRLSSRSGATVLLNLTTKAERDAAVFADPYDMELHGWAQQRFARDLTHHGLSPEVCARDVCPSAAEHFNIQV